MSSPRYESYKDSGVEWLGEVPEHWKTASLRWLSKRYSGGTPDKLNLDYWTDGTIPWLNSGAVNDPIITKPSAFITEEAFQNSSAKWIPKDALVMALAGQGKTKGMVAQIGFQTTCNQSMAAIIPTKEIEARFLYWWLTINYQNIRNMAGGDLRDGLNLELLGNIPCPLVPFHEQRTIAAFLDRETAKIDALITEQQRLIELLKEKRQAVISHAVTKGLNPNAPMKNSGIEWLGEMPEHWDAGPLKRFADIIDCKHHTVAFLDEGLPIVSIREVRDDKIDLSNAKLTSTGEWDFLREGRIPQHGDMIFCRNASVGAVGYVDFDEPFCMGQDVCLIRPKTSDRFIHYQLISPVIRNQIEALLVGATIRRVNVEEIRSLIVVNPPEHEHRAISTFLSYETAKFDTLTAEAQRGIELLKERRTALISAAVTGKIDVRGLVAVQPLTEAAA
jgi:type I restriction enzyme S subunit